MALVIFSYLFTLMSCEDKGGEVGVGGHIVYPVLSENPVYFSSEAQTKDVYVTNMVWVIAENPETEVREITDTEPRRVVIENDWIKIRFGNDVPEETVEITVKENTTWARRHYNLRLSSEIGEFVLAIVQE